MASWTDRVAELKWQLDVADADIALVNRRLDESQGEWFLHSHLVRELDAHALLLVCFDADGAAAVERLRAELARAKEQARNSNAAALRAAEELKAERAAHC